MHLYNIFNLRLFLSLFFLIVFLIWYLNARPGWQVGRSVVRALDWWSKGRGLESRQEHKKNWVFRVKKLFWLAVGVPNPRVYTHAYERPCTHVKDPVVQVSVWWIMDTWNNQHALVPPKIECGCPSGEGIKNGHICYPSYGGMLKTREKKRQTETVKGTSIS